MSAFNQIITTEGNDALLSRVTKNVATLFSSTAHSINFIIKADKLPWSVLFMVTETSFKNDSDSRSQRCSSQKFADTSAR